MAQFEHEARLHSSPSDTEYNGGDHTFEASVLIWIAKHFGYLPQEGWRISSRVRLACSELVWMLGASLSMASALLQYHASHSVFDAVKPFLVGCHYLQGAVAQIGCFWYFAAALQPREVADCEQPDARPLSLRRNFYIVALVNVIGVWAVIALCVDLLQGTSHDYGPLLCARYPSAVYMFGFCAIFSSLSITGAICFLPAMPASICDDIIAVCRALNSSTPNPAYAKQLYDILLKRMRAIRPFYMGYGMPLAAYCVIAISTVTALQFTGDLKRQGQGWVAMAAFWLIWVAGPATRIPVHHSRLVMLIAQKCCTHSSLEIRELAISVQLCKDAIGMKFMGQIVTARLLVASISTCGTFIGLLSKL